MCRFTIVSYMAPAARDASHAPAEVDGLDGSNIRSGTLIGAAGSAAGAAGFWATAMHAAARNIGYHAMPKNIAKDGC